MDGGEPGPPSRMVQFVLTMGCAHPKAARHSCGQVTTSPRRHGGSLSRCRHSIVCNGRPPAYKSQRVILFLIGNCPRCNYVSHSFIKYSRRTEQACDDYACPPVRVHPPQLDSYTLHHPERATLDTPLRGVGQIISDLRHWELRAPLGGYHL